MKTIPKLQAEALRLFQPEARDVIDSLRAKLPREAYNRARWLLCAAEGIIIAVQTWDSGSESALIEHIKQRVRKEILIWVRRDPDEEANPIEHLSDEQMWEIFDGEERSVCLLHYGHGFEPWEIAQSWRPERKTSEVRAVLTRARAKLREALSEVDGEAR